MEDSTIETSTSTNVGRRISRGSTQVGTVVAEFRYDNASYLVCKEVGVEEFWVQPVACSRWYFLSEEEYEKVAFGLGR